MFDTTLVASNRRREVKRKLATLPAALAVHAMAFGFVMVGQLWAVDQVPEMVPLQPLVVHILPPPGDGNADKPGHHTRHVPAAHVARPPLVQPPEVPSETPKAKDPEPSGPNTVLGGGRLDGEDGTDSGPGMGTDGENSDESDEKEVESVTTLRIGGEVLAPVAVIQTPPQYPEVARRLGIQGLVLIETIIDEFGNVTNPVVTKEPGFGLGAAALDVVRTWRYKPATLNRRAVRVYMAITLNFHLSGAA